MSSRWPSPRWLPNGAPKITCSERRSRSPRCRSHTTAETFPRFVEADLAFHEVLFEAADNAFLEALMQPLASVIRDLREETSSAAETREHAIDFHGRILRRVADRDAEGAREDMREHLTLTEQYMERFRVRARHGPAAS